MRSMENELKKLRIQIIEKEESFRNLTAKFDEERDEKMMILVEKEKQEKLWKENKENWNSENAELKKQINEMVEIAKKDNVSVNRPRTFSEFDVNDIHQAYQRAVNDKESLENDNQNMKQEIYRLQRIISKPNQLNSHSRSVSNASSQNEEDFGYSSARNTLEPKKANSSTPTLDENEKCINDEFVTYEREFGTPESLLLGTSKNASSFDNSKSQVALLLRIRKLLEDEKKQKLVLEQKISRLQNKSNVSYNNEDSLRLVLSLVFVEVFHDFDFFFLELLNWRLKMRKFVMTINY